MCHRSMAVALVSIVILQCVGVSVADDAPAVRHAIPVRAIVVEASSDVAVHTAATELQDHLTAAGIDPLPIVSPSDADDRHGRIVIGDNPLARTIASGVEWDALADDATVVFSDGSDMVLAGGSPRGTLYAVHTYLEDDLGFRWWTPSASRVPSLDRLQIPAAVQRVYSPPITYREYFHRFTTGGIGGMKWEPQPAFCARMKLNGHHNPVGEAYGGNISILGWAHTFDKFVPPAKYFGQHPDWYAMQGGRRVSSGQLELTSDAAAKEMAQQIRQIMEQRPGDWPIVSVSQNDRDGFSESPEHAKILRRSGSHAGPLLYFVNRVALDLKRTHPEILVSTLAYMKTRDAPRGIKAADNVIVRLATDHIDYAHPLASRQANPQIANSLAGWSRISDRLYLWNYSYNFAAPWLPHPVLMHAEQNYKDLVEAGVTGVFEQADAYTTFSDFNELNAWVLSKLMWDPSASVADLEAEFLDGYYGPGADAIARYRQLLNQKVQDSGVALHWVNEDWAFMDDELRERGRALWDEAENAVADDAGLAERVERARLSFDFAYLNSLAEARQRALLRGDPLPGPQDPAAELDRWRERMKRHDHKQWATDSASRIAKVEGLRHRLAMTEAVGPPPGLPRLRADQWMAVEEYQLNVIPKSSTTTAEHVADEMAGDGHAIRLSGNTYAWLIQHHLTSAPLLRWRDGARMFVVVRVETDRTEGHAFSAGIYDPRQRTEMTKTDVQLEDLVGDGYHVYEVPLGRAIRDPGMKLWFSVGRGGDPDDMVYLDRILFVDKAALPRGR